MPQQKLPSQKLGKTDPNITIAKIGIVTGIIAVIGTIATGAFSYFSTRSQIEIPIQATQTAIAMQTMAALSVSQSPSPTDTATPTLTPMPIPTANPTPKADTWIRPADEMIMVHVPAGRFEMGISDDELGYVMRLCGDCQRESFGGEQPMHSVSLDGFWIDRTEVTNVQYQRCVETKACEPPLDNKSSTRDPYYSNNTYDKFPVVNISWQQAEDYCKWAGGRLPTDAEWEYAARGQQHLMFPWGNILPNSKLANYNGNVGDTVEVGSYLDGVSWCGALDMAGNAWEWTSDWYSPDYFSKSPPKNPTGPPTGSVHGLRGGSWSAGQVGIRTSQRDFYTVEWAPFYLIGFRCVRPEGK
jgi:formylglycine-generating enzyme